MDNWKDKYNWISIFIDDRASITLSESYYVIRRHKNTTHV
jgi:hypothetical protein